MTTMTGQTAAPNTTGIVLHRALWYDAFVWLVFTSSTRDSSGLWRCPKCGGPMKVIERFTAAEIQLRSPPFISAAA